MQFPLMQYFISSNAAPIKHFYSSSNTDVKIARKANIKGIEITLVGLKQLTAICIFSTIPEWNQGS